MENYLHPDAICEARGLRLSYAPTDDVAELAARAAFVPSAESASWEQLSHRARRRQRDRAKRWLLEKVAANSKLNILLGEKGLTDRIVNAL